MINKVYEQVKEYIIEFKWFFIVTIVANTIDKTTSKNRIKDMIDTTIEASFFFFSINWLPHIAQ